MKPIKVYDLNPVLPVTSMQESLDYYRDKMGFQVDFTYGEPVEYAGISVGDADDEDGHSHIHLSISDNSEIPIISLYIFIHGELEEAFNLFKERDATIIREIEEFPWGMKEFVLADNNGHRFIFAKSTTQHEEE